MSTSADPFNEHMDVDMSDGSVGDLDKDASDVDVEMTHDDGADDLDDGASMASEEDAADDLDDGASMASEEDAADDLDDEASVASEEDAADDLDDGASAASEEEPMGRGDVVTRGEVIERHDDSDSSSSSSDDDDDDVAMVPPRRLGGGVAVAPVEEQGEVVDIDVREHAQDGNTSSSSDEEGGDDLDDDVSMASGDDQDDDDASMDSDVDMDSDDGMDVDEGLDVATVATSEREAEDDGASVGGLSEFDSEGEGDVADASEGSAGDLDALSVVSEGSEGEMESHEASAKKGSWVTKEVALMMMGHLVLLMEYGDTTRNAPGNRLYKNLLGLGRCLASRLGEGVGDMASLVKAARELANKPKPTAWELTSSLEKLAGLIPDGDEEVFDMLEKVALACSS